MRKFYLLVAFVLLFSVMLSGLSFAANQKAYLISDKVYVPLRSIAEWMEVKVDYQNNKITIAGRGKTIEMSAGSKTAKVDGQSRTLPSPPKTLNNLTYVSVRFVAENLGANVEYDSKGSSVKIADQSKTTTLKVEVYKEPSKAKIWFTYVPPYGSSRDLRGKVSGVNTTKCKVAVYIFAYYGWWTKPFWDSPLTSIARDGSWECDITTGGVDETATQIVAYLVPATYNPPLGHGEADLPSGVSKAAVAKVSTTRNPK